MYPLKKELKRISSAISSAEVNDVELFMGYNKTVKEHFGDRTGEWVRFDTFEDFRVAIHALLYTSILYSSFATGEQEGILETTGYCEDLDYTYAWWTCTPPNSGKAIYLDGKKWDYDEAWFDIRQPLGRGMSFFEVRIRVTELVDMKLDLS